MSSQTSLVAKQCRLQTWAAQIHDCQERPKGMSVDDWCLQHGITKANYYYRLRRVRQACLDSVAEEIQEEAPVFVEVPLPAEHTEPVMPSSAEAVAAVVHTISGLEIRLYESASEAFLQKLLGVLRYA